MRQTKDDKTGEEKKRNEKTIKGEWKRTGKKSEEEMKAHI